MNTTKWKSVVVPREVYEEIKELARSEGRTISGQLRIVFDWYKWEEEGMREHAERLEQNGTRTKI
jgi:hypothetical protein